MLQPKMMTMEKLVIIFLISCGLLIAFANAKIISTKDESVLHLRESFLNVLETTKLKTNSDVVVIARYRGSSTKYEKYRVEQIWTEHYNGGLVPYQRIRVKKLASNCQGLVKNQSYFLLLKQKRGKRVLVGKGDTSCPVQHDYSSSEAIHFEEKVHSVLCGRKVKHCGMKIATGRYKEVLTFFVGRNVTFVCPAMINQRVSWFSREKNWASQNRWQPAAHHMEGLMQIEGRNLQPMSERLQLAHSDVEYKCQADGSRRTKLAMFTIRVSLPEDVVTPCGTDRVCHNGGKCSHGVCRCTAGYIGRECLVKYQTKRRIF